ncbi:hypothetical protein LTR22_027199 [Elasticomyces elasticus]|nr:hypothetical protein LTR22_027199 [Elasticomyces elasticus]KAK5745234.1 hypothetical protein LTS12_023207 [Elasticomyces elasticus]
MTTPPMRMREPSFSNRDSRIGNQAGHDAAHPDTLHFTGASRFVSVPSTTVATYTERANLSAQLEEKLGEKSRDKKLAHAVTVTGLGGTGKTQLVLRYIEEHEEEYDCILWIDARSEKTARSSCERCCRAIGLSVEPASGPGGIQDIPAVQAVLRWLRSRATTQRWMFVVDNADQLDWGVQRIVPAGEAGSVIVTSQDGHVSQLLGRRSELEMVEEMNPEEACSLLLKAVDEDGSSASEELPALSTRIVDMLDRLALAIDLAAARIGSDVDRGDEVRVAMHRYLTDFQRHQDKLLQSKEFNEASHYDQTVWTVWEASLASLRSIEDRESLIQPVAFLTLLTFLDRANIRTELFRLASGGVRQTCEELNTDLPLWLEQVLAQGEDKQWDDFYYRETIKPLIRFGLVRWTQDTWPGLTMHGFVRWRAAKEREETACWQWYTTFCTAACMQKAVEVATAEFRRHMLVHLPPIGRLLKDGGQSARTWRMEKLGEEHVDTLSAMANLASTYWKQGRVEGPQAGPHWWGSAESGRLAIEYARQLGQRSPQTWVLWLHASNAARFEQSVRDVADQLKLYGRKDPKANLLQLLRNWLRDEGKGRWLVVLDNADDAVLLLEPSAMSGEAESAQRRIEYIPMCDHGSVMITTRSRGEALRLVYDSETIEVLPMSKNEAEALLNSKLEQRRGDHRTLALALDCMPLAITLAAAYIRERTPRCSVREYHKEMERSRASRTSLLRRNISLPSRDAEANNSVLVTWQISFEHIYITRRSAAELLSLVSVCDRLAIPESLLRINDADGDEDCNQAADFEEDMMALRSFSIISQTADAQTWEMHRLVQDATQVWLGAQGRLDDARDRFVHHLYRSFPTAQFENWPSCRALFPHAKGAVEQKPSDTGRMLEWATVMYRSAWYALGLGN